MKHDDDCCHIGGTMPCICALPKPADTPGTLEDKPVGGDFSLRAFNVVRCLAQAEFRSEIDRCKDEAEYLMSTLRGEKQADYLRVHFPELDEIASLRARVEAMREALVDLMSWFPEKPSDPEWRIKGGKFGADDAVEHARSLVEKEPAT